MRSEFEFIDQMRSQYELDRIGDDCAVLPKDSHTDLLLTADLLIEDIDFRLEWTKPEYFGHKALAVSLSDIAAMGGEPKWAMLSIGVAEKLWKTDFLDRFYAGWHELANKFGVELVGGDVSRSPDKVVIDSILGGSVPTGRAILRSGARPGDGIFVTGTLGGAAGGLKLLESDPESSGDLVEKQLRPQPQLEVGKLLQQMSLATAMIDVSDGLLSDLAHICRASHVGAEIDLKALPINPDLMEKFPAEECLSMALHGGEDLGLLFTGDLKAILAADTLDVTHIGQITAQEGVVEIIDGANRKTLDPQGYRHF